MQSYSEVWGSGLQLRIWGGTWLSQDAWEVTCPLEPRFPHGPGRALTTYLSAFVGEHTAVLESISVEVPVLPPSAGLHPPALGGSRLGGETPQLLSAHVPVQYLPVWLVPGF